MINWDNTLLQQRNLTDAKTVFSQASDVGREQLTVGAIFELKDAIEQIVDKIRIKENPHIRQGK